MAERSTMRQRELLTWVDTFIKEHGYGPSYREIMNGLGYKSVSTVAIHINGLISRGYLQKRDNSARSLEVVSAEYGTGAGPSLVKSSTAGSSKEKWMVEAIDERFTRYKQQANPQLLDELYVLIGALKVLGFDGAYEAMRSKLADLSRR